MNRRYAEERTIPVRARGDSVVPGRGTRSPKPKTRRPPEVLTDAEVRALLDACGRYTATGLRHRAMLALLYRAGLRISEALSLRPHDVDLAAGTVRVRFGKGGYDRVAGLDAGAGAIVAAWMTVRMRMAVSPTAPLLCTGSGKAMTTAYVRRLLPVLGRRAGIAKRVHAHGFRHTHAAQLRAEGVDVAIISRQLGHRSILTTIRYLDHLNPTAVIDAMRKREW
ncbi:MAG: tyrosine-type recombinase/integrase [Phycisphaeraceae bacterium]|nr:tyrosine-type recombinase/integrase [Phycisphaerae bacterium]MBX3391101.1 tyrosine-type recombinase/integrase [Phycisphaeraceae bacterium]